MNLVRTDWVEVLVVVVDVLLGLLECAGGVLCLGRIWQPACGSRLGIRSSREILYFGSKHYSLFESFLFVLPEPLSCSITSLFSSNILSINTFIMINGST